MVMSHFVAAFEVICRIYRKHHHVDKSGVNKSVCNKRRVRRETDMADNTFAFQLADIIKNVFFMISSMSLSSPAQWRKPKYT